jgi:outer membrane protein assembly factor BamB
MQNDIAVHDTAQEQGNAMNTNRGESPKEKKMTAITKANVSTSAGRIGFAGHASDAASQTALIPLLLCIAMTGWSADAAVGGNGQPPYSWRGINGSGVFPAQGIVTRFYDLAGSPGGSPSVRAGMTTWVLPGAPGSRKNIVWRTTLPHWGQNSPVAVKDRVFVLCEEGWKSDAPLLVCCDVKDGKILWQEPVDHLDAWPADKATVAKETRAKHLRYWREYMTWWNKLYWDNEKNAWKEGVTHRKGNPPEVIPPEQTALAAEAAKAGFNLPPTAGIGVSGGVRGRYYWGVGTEEMKQTYEACAKNRYHWYPGWTSEGPYFGSCMGSVVSDGQRVYAVTALDGAACFDLDGKRLWVADLEGKQLVSYPASADRIHNHMASPVLAGGKLMYYHKDAVEFIALDAQTGRLAWRTPGPQTPWPKKAWGGSNNRFFQTEGMPIGYEGGHMVPGGTPLVMVLGTTPVVISGHGMVCRIADGKFLGQVGFPAELAKTSKSDDADTAVNAPEKGLAYASSYTSWVAGGDMLYALALGRLIAVRLSLDGEKLRQEEAWNLEGIDGRNPNPALFGQTLYVFHRGKRGAGGVKALDTATGKILGNGPGVSHYVTALGFAQDRAIWKIEDLAGSTQDVRFQGTPATVPGRGLAIYTIVSLPDLKPLGQGHLWSEPPTGDIAQRHIAALGHVRLAQNNSAPTCWGNRIFIRDNDYLWCVGNPAEPWHAPESCMK